MWTSETEIETGLSDLVSANGKKEALKLQIKFRKKVLSQAYYDKTIFQFSHNRKPFSVAELKQNLLKLLSTHEIPHQSVSVDKVNADPEILLYRRVEHQFNCDGALVWFRGTILGYDKDTSLFRVVYDNEEDECHFPLLEDLANNELSIIDG